MNLLHREQAPAVLLSVGVALGHLQAPRALSALVKLASHPSAEARYGAAHGLAVLNAPEAVEALIRLSADEDRDVRDWATFGLGSMMEDVDTPRCGMRSRRGLAKRTPRFSERPWWGSRTARTRALSSPCARRFGARW
ncbi:HEAT repeat domain-containing protein [Corallococcus macrosporus]|uniref:HEAT repeat domain-containing protein n=1 Tax=Corallococcus macrosporus TaxID=35 RepID=UPI0039BF6C80